MDRFSLGTLTNPFIEGQFDPGNDTRRSSEEACARLRYLVGSGQPCGFLQGSSGTGKTRLLQSLEGDLRRSGRQVVRIDLTGLNAIRLLTRLEAALGLNCGGAMDSLQTWDTVLGALEGIERAGLDLCLLLDHAEAAQHDVWTLLDQCLSLRAGGLCVIVASGSAPAGPLVPFLRRHAGLRIELKAFDLEETFSYIQACFAQIGYDGTPFTDDAIERVHALTSGEPRRIQQLCGLAVLAATAEGAHEIDEILVNEAAIELDLGT